MRAGRHRSTAAGAITSPSPPSATSPPLATATLATLEDGSAIALGDSGDVTHYLPTTDAWTAVAPSGAAPGPLQAPVIVPLVDGTLLVLGSATAPDRAWLYRPAL